MELTTQNEFEDGNRKVAIRREARPVIVESDKGDKIEYHELPVPPPTDQRRPANSPY